VREKRMVTCTNGACKKTFVTPLQALNLQQEPEEPYAACPYCLTRIDEIDSKCNNKTEKLSQKAIEKEEKPKLKPVSCKYHLGYLSEREQKEQIPDECIVCKYIVDCMLQKMRA